jgi:hypothetical protein
MKINNRSLVCPYCRKYSVRHLDDDEVHSLWEQKNLEKICLNKECGRTFIIIVPASDIFCSTNWF